MSMSKDKPKKPKAKYETPRVVYREPLEAAAAACTGGTAKGDFATCPSGPISS